MTNSSNALWGLVLAGGDGTRLQALTRLLSGAPIPKQYCRIVGERSLLETTLARIRPVVTPERTVVVVNRAHLDLARPQLGSLPAANVLVQPRNLDTGPGLLMSLLALARRDPNATVAVFPSDHDVRNGAAFQRHVVRMARLTALHPDTIALLGARPDRPETGYGYIAPGARVAGTGNAEAFRVAAFHEKPARAFAVRLLRTGGLWNSFVMMGHVARFVELLRQVRPADVAALPPIAGDADALASVYERITPWNFSRDFLAHIPEHLLVARADDLGWSDWGTPESIERTLATMGVVPPWRAPLRATA